MKPKVLKTEEEYRGALAYLETLMDAAPGSPEEEELELFGLLVEQYEDEHYPIDLPDPVDAILFRMDQEGLTRKDLIPYLGSLSKVSEVLNRKRPLSLAMIRSLHEGLGIPADVLLQEPGKKLEPAPRYDVRDYPFAQMHRRGYFGAWQGNLTEAKARSEELLAAFFAPLGALRTAEICCRHADNAVDYNALTAWQARVLTLAMEQELPAYNPDALDEGFFKKIVRASFFDEGPSLVPRLLREHGVHFVLLAHLPKTYLDGAAFLTSAGRPVVGMTLRYDRLDNFWFTLLHELAHVRLHLHGDGPAFFDDTEHDTRENEDPREAEANALAREALIPAAIWQEEGPALLESSLEQPLVALAQRLEISPAIVAGRVRWESGDYSRFTRLVGRGKVRRLFEAPTPVVTAQL